MGKQVGFNGNETGKSSRSIFNQMLFLAGLVRCLATMNDGRRIVSGSKDQSLKIWDLVTLQCCVTLKGHTDLIWQLAVASNDSFIVSASKDDMLKVSSQVFSQYIYRRITNVPTGCADVKTYPRGKKFRKYVHKLQRTFQGKTSREVTLLCSEVNSKCYPQFQ